jgi:FkbH-like protein
MSDFRSRIKAAIEEGPRDALHFILEALDSGSVNSVHAPILTKYLNRIAPEVFTEAGFVTKKIAVLSGYTFHTIQPLLQLQLLRRGIHAHLWISEYGLYEQAIQSRDADLLAFKPDICYFFVGRDHLHFESRDSEAERWLLLWNTAHDNYDCEIIANDFELPEVRPLGNYELKFDQSVTNYVIDVNRKLAAQAPSYVHFNNVSALSGYHGSKAWRDDRLYDISKIPVAEPFWQVYAENIAAVVAGVFGKSRKCLVLDLDNTLWGGVVGDDGISGIQIGEDSGTGEAFRRFQTAVKALKDRGVLLAVCSKNDLVTAQEPFLKRSEMLLKLEDFSYFCANWEPKDQNLITIATALNLGLDSMIFADDNPAERAIIRRSLPQVAVLELPEDPADYARTLGRCSLFDVVTLTLEDMDRTASYQSVSARKALQAQAGDYSDYLHSLEMVGSVSVFDELNVPRITQLINKTNQFNLTTRRYTETQVRGWMANPSALTFVVSLKDRFGDYGLISVFIGVTDARDMEIDTWLMSCRVLKRGVERLLFRSVVQQALARSLVTIRGRYIPTAKNGMVAELYRELGFELEKTETDGSTLWIFDLDDEARVNAQLNQPVFVEG